MATCRLVLAAFVLILWNNRGTDGAAAAPAAANYRLPGDLLPQLYDLRILTNIADLNENYTFNGDVAIWVS